MKRYKCNYCDFRGEKDELVDHIDDKHHDMLPKGFTPSREVFKIINKKDHGICMVCKKNTEWNEDRSKYQKLCGRKSCKQKLRSNYQNNMLRVRGTYNILDDPDQQQKMLANRKISGTYSMKDGEKITFTGSYEKKLLEFMNTVLNVNSYDIQMPGPVLEYEYNGKKLKWITDMLYIPYNLIIEVKDGGSNPNTRQMDSYREKQIEKEKMITNLGTYNYLRLTDNNFQQLIEVFIELKDKFIDDIEENKNALIKINETAGMAAVAGALANTQAAYVIPYGYNNVFSGDVEGFALSNDIITDNILVIDNEGKVKTENYSFLENRLYSIYKFKGDYSIVKEMLTNLADMDNCDRELFYSKLTGLEMLTDDQIKYDSLFEEVDINKIISKTTSEASTIIQEYNKYNNELYYIPLITDKDIIEKNKLIKENKHIDVLEDCNGYFAINTVDKRRTISYDSIKDIIIEGVK